MDELGRLDFIEDMLGPQEAMAFAVRTLALYRECLALDGKEHRKFHHATLPQYREEFEDSCAYFESYIKEKRLTAANDTGTAANNNVQDE